MGLREMDLNIGDKVCVNPFAVGKLFAYDKKYPEDSRFKFYQTMKFEGIKTVKEKHPDYELCRLHEDDEEWYTRDMLLVAGVDYDE